MTGFFKKDSQVRKIKIIAGILSVLVFIICVGMAKDPDAKSLELRANDFPSDMIFIPGNDSISSFYIGRTEECNRNYLTYLRWLYVTYGADYPDVFESALPDTTLWMNKIQLSDPYSQDYFRNPSYAFYPVVGVSWKQANDYCHWKGDRYNECILIREGILYFNPNQINEDIFNTESYLSGQYEGLVKADILNKDTHDTTKVLFRHHMLVPNFRLPTEAEWEYAATMNPNLKSTSKIIFKPNYFLNRWEDYRGIMNETVTSSEPDSIKHNNLFFDVRGDEPLIHIDDNVSEWTYDIDFGDNLRLGNDLVKIYARCYQPFSDEKEKDEMGMYVEKDSLGLMPFDYLCDDKNAKPVLVKSYRDPIYDSARTLPASGTVKRIYRGGDYNGKGINNRGSLIEDSSSINIGFRCALTMMKTN